MKSAILTESKKPLTVAEVNLPKDLKFGQVLVKIFYSGICGAQINEIDAAKGSDKYLPHLLGHEGSGIVEQIGEGVTRVKKEDRVVLHWRKGAGIESAIPKYSWNGKQVNAGRVTTFNEKAIVSENRLTVIPTNFDMRLAALFGCSVLTGFGVVNNDAKIKIGQSVLIFGVGGVGLNIAQASSMVSAYPIIGVDLYQNKIDMGKKFGLTHGIIANSDDIIGQVKNILGDKGVDIAIETTGKTSVIEQAYKLTADDGKTILVGVPNEKISIYSLPLAFNKILRASHGGNSIPDKDIPRYIKLIENKKMSLDKLITHEFDLSEINVAIDLFRSGRAGRIIININKEK